MEVWSGSLCLRYVLHHVTSHSYGSAKSQGASWRSWVSHLSSECLFVWHRLRHSVGAEYRWAAKGI